MSICFFTLHPFYGAIHNPPHIRITGQVSKTLQSLAIGYQLAGELTAIHLPESSEHPERRDCLWKGTCFELFVKKTDSEGYREINLSPAGYWNIYRFDKYRKGMQEETGVAAPRIRVGIKNEGILKISTDIHLDAITALYQPIQVAVSAVIQTVTGQLSYWALTHPGPEPDFHHKDSFVIRLE